LTQITTMSDFGNTLITCKCEAQTILLKIWVLWITLSIISGVMERLISSMNYKIPKILKQDFDCGSLGLITLFESILFKSFIYFSTMFKSESVATLLVIMTIPIRVDVVCRNFRFYTS